MTNFANHLTSSDIQQNPQTRDKFQVPQTSYVWLREASNPNFLCCMTRSIKILF